MRENFKEIDKIILDEEYKTLKTEVTKIFSIIKLI